MKRGSKSTPSQRDVPQALREAQGITVPGQMSTAIGQNRMATPNRDKVGSGAVPEPSSGHNDFTYESTSAGRRK